MKHIDVILYANFISKQFPFITKEGLRYQLESTLNYPITITDLNAVIQLQQPNTQQIVHALRDKGFAPKYIAEQLQINPTTVSYHLSRPLKKEYVNPYLRWLENQKEGQYSHKF